MARQGFAAIQPKRRRGGRLTVQSQAGYNEIARHGLPDECPR
jgi:hypothetical protein